MGEPQEVRPVSAESGCGAYTIRMSLSSHQSAKMRTDEWLTPPEWIEKLGPFNLDPCCPHKMPWKTADIMLTKDDNGLEAYWGQGRIWLNPPFGREPRIWLEKLAWCRNGIALVAARTETKWFYDMIWKKAEGICFVSKRPHFHYPDGSRAPFNSGAPICLVAYGLNNAEVLRYCGLGPYINDWTI